MAMTNGIHRAVLIAAGILGMVGVMSAAAASHGTDTRNFSAMAMICLAHAPALLALGLSGRTGRLWLGAGVALAIGSVLFCADLALRQWIGHGAFPGAAPLAGIGMIGGWLAVLAAAIIAN